MKKGNLWKCCLGLVAVSMLLTGCGSSSEEAVSQSVAVMEYSAEMAPEESNGLLMDNSAQETTAAWGESSSAVQVQDPLEDRKLIKTVDMSVETKEFDTLLETLEEGVTQLGGYIERLETYNGSVYSGYGNSRNASVTIRVPQSQLDIFLDRVGTISNVVQRTQSVQDVTLTYVDMESRKKALQAEYDRLVELIAEAEYLEDILTIEERLTNVRYQLESMESQLRTYDNKIHYSTVCLSISEVMELTPAAEETVWQRITGGFCESLQDIGEGFLNVGVWFLVNIPYFILWIIIIVVIIFVMKGLQKVFKSGKKKKNRSAEVTGEQSYDSGQQKE